MWYGEVRTQSQELETSCSVKKREKLFKQSSYLVTVGLMRKVLLVRRLEHAASGAITAKYHSQAQPPHARPSLA